LGSGFSHVLLSATTIGNSQGLAWADYDNDGDFDLYLPSNDAFSATLFRKNSGNTFTNVAATAGVNDTGEGRGVAWGDYDLDGDLDLFVVRQSVAKRLYKNNGDGTFSDVATAAGVANTSAGLGATWADYDADGDLDLYQTNISSQSNNLYRNNGNGTFTDVAAAANVNSVDNGRGTAWIDYDGDGDLDVYVADNGPNHLYRNNANGTFSSVEVASGVSYSGNGKQGVWGDYDGDRDFDLFITNFNTEADRLYRNNGNGTFTEVAAAAGVNDTGSGQGASWGDYDCDGDLDLYVSNEGANRLYRNNGGTFTDVAQSLGVADSGKGQAVSWIDFDADGDLDLYLSNEESSSLLYVNALNPYTNTYLKVILLDGSSRWTQHGVRAEILTTSGSTFVAASAMDGGSGYLSQNAFSMNFCNLAPSTSYDVKVYWNDGTTSQHTLGTPSGPTIRKICKGTGLC
jgi:hypothetical protein